MNQHSFTAALAEQHRADLMTSARQARDYRRATAARARTRTLRSWPRLTRIAWSITRGIARPRESF
jgi:hypothetical protein